MDTVRTVEGVPDTVLYERAKEWMLRNMKSADSQVSLDDKAKEKLIGTPDLLLPNKTWNAFSYSGQRMLNFKLSVFVKDGRYRKIIENIVHPEVAVSQNDQRPGMISMEGLLKHERKPKANGKPSKENKFDGVIAEFEGAITPQ